MKTTSSSLSLLLAAAVLGGCAGDSGVDPMDFEPGEPGEVDAVAIEAAAEVSDLVTDIGEFLADSLVPLPGFAGPGAFMFAPASCTGSVEIGPGTIAIEKDCTLPSGRHVRGSLVIEPAACGLRGFAVEYDLLVESQPGAADEVLARGTIKLSFGAEALYLAVEHSSEVHGGGHSVAKDAAGCFVLDKVQRVIAADGAVSLAIDGQTKLAAEVADLQHAFCESLPYTGQLAAEHPPRRYALGFERLDADTVRVTLDENGNVVTKDLPVLRLSAPFCHQGIPSPIAFDYATCGGCGHPNPPDLR